MSQFIHIGFGNIVNTDKIIAVVSPDSAPVKRLVQKARETGNAVDATQGRRTKAVLVMENSQLILSALRRGLSCRRIRSRLQRRKNRMNHRGLLVVVSGFSGVGKGTLVKKLVTECDNYALSVSMTTRKPRKGEIDGVSYFFVDHDTFEQTIAQDGLVEYASYVGNYYGTPKTWVEEQRNSGKDVVLEIEVQGALKVKEKFPDAVLIFVLPPSAKELKSRLEGRGTETQDVVLKRLSRAEEESAFVEQYDYIVVNDDLGVCMEAVNGIVRAEHQRPNLNLEHITNLKEELNALVKGEN